MHLTFNSIVEDVENKLVRSAYKSSPMPSAVIYLHSYLQDGGGDVTRTQLECKWGTRHHLVLQYISFYLIYIAKILETVSRPNLFTYLSVIRTDWKSINFNCYLVVRV